MVSNVEPSTALGAGPSTALGAGGVDRALVLTAGVATRLRPLSLARAKAAVPVAGVPLVERILRWLARQRVAEAVLNLHYRPETIARVVGDGAQTGVRVRYSWEQPLLGSAGGPRKALPLVGADRFFIVNGDTLTDVDLDAVADAHARAGALVTMALIPNPRPDRYGGIVVEDGFVRGFTPPVESGSSRTPQEPTYHFIGVQVAEADAFASVPDDRPSESVGALYPQLVRARRDAVAAYVCDAAFHDIGTPADYLETSLRVAAEEGDGRLAPGRDSTIAPGARVERTAIWDRVVVEQGASLVDCVVADDVRIPARTRLTRRAIVRASGAVALRGGERVKGDLLIAPL
jgi:NDP-sugar pyrophosphorylase family protein